MRFRVLFENLPLWRVRFACTPYTLEASMKKKTILEADLDPPGTRSTRPGSKIADAAIALSKPARGRKRRSGAASASRPGATAATRAVAATKAKRKRSR